MVGPFRPGTRFPETVALWSSQMQLIVTISKFCDHQMGICKFSRSDSNMVFLQEFLFPPAPTFPAMDSHLAELTLPFPLHIKAAQKQSKDLEITI